MRDLGQLLNAHLGCTHKTTEVRFSAEGFMGYARLRHGPERYELTYTLSIDEMDDHLAPRAAVGSSLFHGIVRAIRDSDGEHSRNPVHITDAEYAGILDA